MRATMRMHTAGSIALLLAGFLACDSSVTTVDGGGGSGAGIGGTPSTGGSPNPTTGGGGFGQGGVSANGGAGIGGQPPMNGCEQTCANVEACFGATCAQAGIDCSQVQAQCIGDCLKDASCSDLAAFAQGQPLPPDEQACVDVCTGGGQGGGGGGTQQGCGQCVFQSGCLAPCMNQPMCQGWGQCAFNCTDPACYTACNEQFPEAQPYYSQIYQCACTSCSGTGCDTQMDPCNQGSGGTGVGGMGGGP